MAARETQSALETLTNSTVPGLVTQSVVETIVGVGVQCGSPPDGIVGTAYTHTFPAGGGEPPLSFSISAGALPPGLVLNGATGDVTGTPTLAGVFAFTVQVMDSIGQIDAISCFITITGGGFAVILYGYKLFPVPRVCGDLKEMPVVPEVDRVL